MGSIAIEKIEYPLVQAPGVLRQKQRGKSGRTKFQTEVSGQWTGTLLKGRIRSTSCDGGFRKRGEGKSTAQILGEDRCVHCVPQTEKGNPITEPRPRESIKILSTGKTPEGFVIQFRSTEWGNQKFR